jgi:uncharacterized repeat protein (TIGR03803 family)
MIKHGSVLGFIFSMVLVSQAQTVQVIYNFNGTQGGANPLYGTPVQGQNGHLYSTAYDFPGDGGIFEINVKKGAAETLPVFNGTNGRQPSGGLTLGSDGAFYGTTSAGGSPDMGVLFRINPNGRYSILHEFQGGSDGLSPVAPPIQATDGNFYGTTAGSIYGTAATVYEYTPSSQMFTTLFTLDPSVGQGVYAPLVQASDGNLYGTASSGGGYGNGTIFSISTSGQLLNTYSFPGAPGGAAPYSALIQGTDGNFYGTTEQGGVNQSMGTVFSMDTSFNVTVLYSFGATASDGTHPLAGLSQATDGNLYGSTPTGGASNAGTLFQISTAGAYNVLYMFSGTDGQSPTAPPMQATNGILYGTAELGGADGYGSVYSLDMGLGSFVTFVNASGQAGSTAEILGQGFNGTSSVTFNGVPASSFTVVSATYLTAVVPAGATSGPVVVTTPAAVLNSNTNFTIAQ